MQFFRRLDWFISKRILRKSIIRRKLNEFDMYLDLITPGISKTLAIYKSREDDMINVIKEVLKPGMKVIDCGSNIGFYPLLEAKILKGKGQIHAFEPDPRNFKILEKNIKLFKNGNFIKPYQKAISNNNGIEQMFIASMANLNKLSSIDNDKFLARHDVNEIIDVEAITIDTFCEENGVAPDFIRMDIEGYEVEVFQGMKNIFNNAKAGFMIMLELHPHAYSNERSFAKELEYLFELNFIGKILISAGEPVPPKYEELGYAPDEKIVSDGFLRGIYRNVKTKDIIPLTCMEPKASRYILLQKK
jgi:FkbM family methyltransferase